MTGLQLCGIVLAHELLPVTRSPDLDIAEISDDDFYTSIVHRMDAKESEVFAIAAEVWCKQIFIILFF